MIRKSLLLACLMAASNLALAQWDGQWIGGVGYFDLSADIGGYETSPDVYGFNIGYQMKSPIRDFLIIPGLSLYGGIDDDIVKVNNPTTSKVRVETQFGVGINLRFQWEGDTPFYFYIAPAYASFGIEGKEGDVKIDEDDWEAGVGAGIGYNVTDQWRVEVSYDEFGDTDLLGLALRFAF